MGGIVLEGGSVADELVLQRGVRIENGREPVAERFAGECGEVRPDGIADALELVTCATGGLEVRRAALGIGLQLGEVGVTCDDFSAVRVGAAKELAGARGESGLFVGCLLYTSPSPRDA